MSIFRICFGSSTDRNQICTGYKDKTNDKDKDNLVSLASPSEWLEIPVIEVNKSGEQVGILEEGISLTPCIHIPVYVVMSLNCVTIHI